MTSRRNQSDVKNKLSTLLNRLAIILFVVTALASVGIFVLSRDTSYSLLLGQENQLTTEILLLKDKASTMYQLKNRLASISTILKTRQPYDAIFSTSIAQLGDSSVQSYSLSPDSISLTVTSDSLVTLNSWLSSLQAQIQAKSYFSKLSVDSLLFVDKLNSYVLSITLTYI